MIAAAEVDELIARVKAASTKDELDALRPEVGKVLAAGGEDGFEDNFKRLQGAFIKAKNRIRYGRQKALTDSAVPPTPAAPPAESSVGGAVAPRGGS